MKKASNGLCAKELREEMVDMIEIVNDARKVVAIPLVTGIGFILVGAIIGLWVSFKKV